MSNLGGLISLWLGFSWIGLYSIIEKFIHTTRKNAIKLKKQAQEALEVDVRDLRVNIRSRLAQETGGRAFSKKKAETPAGDGS